MLPSLERLGLCGADGWMYKNGRSQSGVGEYHHDFGGVLGRAEKDTVGSTVAGTSAAVEPQ